MLGKQKRTNSGRRHSQAAPDATFDMAAYRRGTTLNSFKGTDSAEKTERQRLKRLRSLRRRLVAILIIVVIVLTFGILLLMQFTNQISSVVAKNGVELSQADQDHYRKIVNDYFAKNSFERFSFARRSSVLLQDVEDQTPEVSAIKLVPAGIGSSKLELTMRQPVAMWIDASRTNFVDSSGVVFSRNYFAVPSLAIEDNSGANSADGMATSANFLSFVGKTAVALEKQGVKVARVVIPRGSARYVEFYLDGRDYPFKAQITRDSNSQASDIAVMTRYIDSHGLHPQYVDCRVEGKAYWK